MSKRNVQWLYAELPGLVQQGVMPAATAERLRQHYGAPGAPGGTAKRWAVVLFSILGAALIGGGSCCCWRTIGRSCRARCGR